MTKVALVAHWDWVLYNFRLPIARRLRDIGYEVVLICPPGRYLAQLESEGFRVVPWRVERKSFSPIGEARAIAELTSIYRRERPEIVHHFTIKPNLYGTIAARAVRVRNIINTFSGMGFLLSESRVAAALRLVAAPLLRVTFRARKVWTVFQNPEDLAWVSSRGWVSADRSRLIAGSGVDVDMYVPRTSDRSPARPVFLMAARLIKEKGVRDFVAAARTVAEARVPARFVVAGEPDPGNPSSLGAEEIEKWKRESPVDFVGHVSDMPGLLADADVAVLPTYYPEGLPRFLLEAAAAGLPLVATDIPPCRPIVLDGYNGYLVPPRHPKALADAISRLARDEGLRKELGDNGRRLVVERFREEDVVNQYVGLYDDLVAQGS